MTELNLMYEAVRYQRTIADNTFEIFSILQSSSNEVLQQSLDQCSWLPEETRRNYNQWINCCRSASDDLKKNVDGCYQSLEGIIAETPLIKTKVAATSTISAVKTKVIAESTGQSKDKRISHPAGAEDRKVIPATAPRSSRKKPAAKTRNVKKQTAVKEKSSLSDPPSNAVTAGVKKVGTETSLAIKDAAVPAANKLPADRNKKGTTPLVAKKKSTQKSS